MATLDSGLDNAVGVNTAMIGLIAQLAVPGDSRGRAEQVERQVEAAIRVGLLSPGDKLPPEPVMADLLGVAPLTLRQSLAALRSRGLVVTRRGRGGGSYVQAEASVTARATDAALLAMSADDIRDLTDQATAVGMHAARLAAARTDDDDITRLGKLAARYRDARSAADAGLADSRFLIGVAVAAQSPRLTGAMAQLQAVIAPLTWGPSWETLLPQVERTNDALVAAVAAGDVGQAAQSAEVAIGRRAEIILMRHLDLVAQEADDE